MKAPRYVILANPETKRWQVYSEELSNFWDERNLRPDIQLVRWADVIPRDGNLDELPVFDPSALVRLESPGKDFEVTKLFLQAGERENGRDGDSWLSLPYQKGLILRPGLQYLGFCRVLRGLKRSFDARPHLTSLVDPLAVIELFDKNATLQRLRQAELPCPESIDSPTSVEELFDQIRKHRFATTYVKLSTSSSASGIAVVRGLEDNPSAITSVVQIDGGFYNTRRLRRSTGRDLRDILDFILSEGCSVQRGIPMAQIDGQNFDVRVVVIREKITHVIFRLSPHPMTNLHLGGRRGEPDYCRAAIPKRAWLDAMDHCLEVAALYPGINLGIDLLFEQGYLSHYFLEANAFGDFFPEWRNADGQTIHRTEIEMNARQFQLI